MRFLLLVSSCVLAVSSAAFAGLPIDQGKLVKGRYFASGKATFAGVTIRYLKARASVSARGRVKATLTKLVTDRAGTLSSTVRLRGSVRSMRFKGGAFTSSARLNLSDGARVLGTFRGLRDPSARLSRYFTGDISGATNTNFVLRAR
jgi:hypothetical protein